MSKLVPGGMTMQHRQGLLFWLCSDPDLGLVCNRVLPALFSLAVTDEKGAVQGEINRYYHVVIFQLI